MIRGAREAILPLKHQADASLDQAAAVQNTWYTVLSTTNARIYSIRIKMDTAIETLECRLTVDGVAYTGAQAAAVVGTDYMFIFFAGLANFLQATADGVVAVQRAFLVEGRSVKVEMRKTTVVGAGTLSGLVRYGKW